MKLHQLTQLTVYEHFGLVNMRAINTGGGVYWTGRRLPALSPARPLVDVVYGIASADNERAFKIGQYLRL